MERLADLAPSLLPLVAYLDAEPVPMIVLDPEYRILAANAAYLRHFAVAGAHVTGHLCHRVSHHFEVPCDQAGETCPMRAARETGAPTRVLHVHHTPRGPEHVDVELRPLFDAAGQLLGYVERLATVQAASARPASEGLVGHSRAFQDSLLMLQRVAPTDLPVLLLGESGTGKELFAKALHAGSPRAHAPFVVVDCTGLPESLFESELFGHEKGAFTGAQQRKHGLVETANDGTLFLDEIGDVPLAMQVKLLRLIEGGTFRRVGGTETLRANFRLVAATHKDLKAMVADGRFRADLYYRISTFPVDLPPLRDRADDLPDLARSLLQRSRVRPGVRLDAEALAALVRYRFPGNVRELRNVLERAALLADDGIIRVAQLPPEVRQAALGEGPAAAGAAPRRRRMGAECADESGGGWVPMLQPPPPPGDDSALRAYAAAFPGTRRQLACQLGLSERTLYRRLGTPPA